MRATIGVMILAGGLAACETTEGFQGAAGGCAVGGLVGALFGAEDEELALACAGGALVGGLTGDYLGKRRQQYASTEAFYRGEIALIHQANVRLEQTVADQDRQLSSLRRDITSLVNTIEDEAALTQALSQRERALSSQISQLNNQIDQLTGQIANSETVLMAMQQDRAMEEARMLETALVRMRSNVESLRGQQRELSRIQTAIVA